MAKSDGPLVSDDSKEFLEDVRKGKPRKFAMICKGAEIISLIVYKRGNVEQYKKEAKKFGAGQFYFGVIEGKGQDIHFVLARADGFDAAPVKTTLLKKFLDEEAELKCKPLFEIRDAAPLVLDTDNPLVARFLLLREEAQKYCEVKPDQAATINNLCREIGGLLDQDDLKAAEQRIDQLEASLNEQGTASDNATDRQESPPPSNEVSPSGEEKASKLAGALGKLRLLLDQAVDRHPERKNELFASMAQVANEIKERKFDQASSNIVSLGRLLQSLAASPPQSGNTASELNALRERQAEMEERLHAAQRAAPEKATALGNVWAYADKQIESGNLVNAATALNKLEATLVGILSAPVAPLVPEGTVKAAKLMLTTWQKGLEKATGELDKLQAHYAQLLPEENVALDIVKITQKLQEFASDLDNALYRLADQPSEDGPIERVKKLLSDYRKRIKQDRLIQHLSNARRKLGIELRVESIFLELFGDLESALAG